MLETPLHILFSFEDGKINFLFEFFFRGQNNFKRNLMQGLLLLVITQQHYHLKG